MLPSPDILNEFPEGKFVLSNLAAKRAKQLREGAPPLVQVDSQHPLTIALAEIAAGKIKPIVPTAEEIHQAEIREFSLLSEEPLPAEMGMLLPALDETEVALVGAVALGEDEVDHDHDHDHDVDHDHDADVADAHEAVVPMSLADLVPEDEEEVTPVAGDEDTLSLSDIAEQETSADEEEGEHEG
jgi:DNA-directed RNA polymerase subunit omega